MNGVEGEKSKNGVHFDESRIDRMITRWAGVRQAGRSRTERTELITSKTETHNLPEYKVDESGVVLEFPKKTPLLAKCEVLVIGGGPSGLSAALGARRAGADVVLMERFGCFGGVITTVGMETIAWYRYEGCMNDSEGIGVEMERLAAQMGGTIKWPYNESECLDADFFKVVADHLVKSSGIRPILHCYAVDSIVENGKIKGVITESKSGRMAILAERVIDCSGDADVAFFSGCQFRTTPKGQAMGMTSVFNCSGVDKKKFLEYTEKNPATYADWSRTWDQETTGKEDVLRSPYLDLEFENAREQGVIPKDSTQNIGGSWSALSDKGEATNLNLAHVQGLDCTNVEDLTKAEMEGREQAMYALQALKKVVPGFEEAKLRNFGMTIGTRDSRKIIARYNLTGADVKNQGKFSDSIGIFPEFIDGYNILILPTTGRFFEVPYGCMIPVTIPAESLVANSSDITTEPKLKESDENSQIIVDNLLVAGRCVSGDMTSHAAMRNMMACTVTGQGAGVAAAVSLRTGRTTSQVDIADIQAELLRQGVRIH